MNSAGPEVVSNSNEGLQVVESSSPNASNAKFAYQPMPQNPPYQPPPHNTAYQSIPTAPQYPPQYIDDEKRPRRSAANPFGLSALAFGSLIALLTALLVGGAVGGIVGGILGSRNKQTCAATSSLNATKSNSSGPVTNYAPVAPQSVNTLELPCPGEDNTLQSTLDDDSFKFQCYYNYAGNDITNLIAYSMADCTQACSNLNAFNGSRYCQGVTFNAELGFEVGPGGQAGNCWLKYALNDPTINQTVPQVSAQLQQ